jgi:putative transposase
LPEGLLQTTWRAIAEEISEASSSKMLWCGLRVAVGDGTTASMPDTAANQAVWPQQRTQKSGCGFPIMRILGLFSLATGAVHSIAIGNLSKCHSGCHSGRTTIILDIIELNLDSDIEPLKKFDLV